MIADAPSIPAGGAESAVDLTDPKDRGLVRAAMRYWPKRWRGLDPQVKDRFVGQLITSMDEVENIDDIAKRVAERIDIVRTAALLEGQNQKDEHHAEGENHNHRHEHTVINCPQPRALPAE